MTPPTGELRFLPEARSAHFERSRNPGTRRVLYAKEYADLDPASLGPSSRRVGPWTAWTWALRARPRVVELPEPLWLRALPFTYSIGLAFRLVDLVLRRRTLIVTYALENNAPERLFRPLPGWGRRVVAGVIRAGAAVVYDRIAFASPAAAACYRRGGVLPPSVATRDFVDLLPPCECAVGEREPGSVVFLGALENRKGLPDLLTAWQALPAARHGWSLRVVGTGPCEDLVRRAAAADTSIHLLGAADRRTVHAVLRRACVVVLPSRREGRWCEQIGLPIAEGLAHGCRVVATPDTGLAPWLRDHGHLVLPDAFTVAHLADALSEALHGAGAAADRRTADLPRTDARILAEDWLRAPDPSDPEPHRTALVGAHRQEGHA